MYIYTHVQACHSRSSPAWRMWALLSGGPSPGSRRCAVLPSSITPNTSSIRGSVYVRVRVHCMRVRVFENPHPQASIPTQGVCYRYMRLCAQYISQLAVIRVKSMKVFCMYIYILIYVQRIYVHMNAYIYTCI